ncbi:MAG: 50S ribosomal protein L31 [Candidatus Yanofskybacteria bacterium]|nr:50S ribosomal protein L31 [Candidatus Yanofskybacteria bacterium]
MKTDIHPQYYPEAKVHCACGNKWTTGSTMPEISVEICNDCHPFYTGREKLLDARGRVEKLKKRMAKSEEMIKAKAPKKPRAKK